MPTSPAAIAASYDPLLVAFSFAIAIAASYTALDVAGRGPTPGDRRAAGWMLVGAGTMGLGIWSMHFVGMTAFHVGIPIAYDVGITLASLASSILGSFGALWTVSHPTMSWRRWLAGTAFLGTTLGLMHYLGMSAMRMQAVVVYDPFWFLMSGAIAMGASGLALAIAYRVRGESLAIWSVRKLGSAVVLGFAIAGMHYAGMAAATFLPAVCAPPTLPSVDMSYMGIAAVASATFFVMAGSLVSAYKASLQTKQADLDAVTVEVARRTRELAEREEALRRANEELRAADRYKDEFLSVISHELRTPLNFITGFASTLADEIQGPLNEAQHAAIAKILNGADRMLLLVDDLLDFAKIQSGKFELAPAPTAYGPLVGEALSLLAPLAAQKGLLLAADAGEPVTLPIDPARITQVLTNLLSNAIKFTDAGEVRVSTRREGGMLLTEVRDQGCGIAEEHLPRLFQRFEQLDMSNTRRASGTGLGLAISKALVEAHGGQIGVRSTLGAGTTIWFTLPLGTPTAPGPAAAPAEA